MRLGQLRIHFRNNNEVEINDSKDNQLKGAPITKQLSFSISLVRGFIRAALVAAFATCIHAAEPPLPNIVIVLADDMTWNDMGCMGSPSVKTPNLDRIATQGAVFDRLYTCTSVCAPTRFQLNTGRMPGFGQIYKNSFWQLAFDNPEYETMPSLFRKVGYLPVIAGKRHFPKESNYPEAGKFPYQVLCEQPTPNIDEVAADFLKQPHDRPFLLYVGFNEPHVRWDRVGSVAYEPAALKLPEYMPDIPVVRDVLADYFGEVTALDDQVGVVFDALQRSPHKDNTLFLFMTEQGSQIPRGKYSCNEMGLRATMLAWWAGRIQAGRRCNAMLHYVDILPTLLDLLGAAPANGIDGRSFLPVLMGERDTFRDAVFGGTHETRSVNTGRYKYLWNNYPEGSPGEPFYSRSKLDGWVYQGRHSNSKQSTDLFLSLVAARESGVKDRRIDRMVDWVYHPVPEELYDLEADPYEMNNLLESPEPPTEVLAGLRRRLGAWLNEQHDPIAEAFQSHLAEVANP